MGVVRFLNLASLEVAKISLHFARLELELSTQCRKGSLVLLFSRRSRFEGSVKLNSEGGVEVNTPAAYTRAQLYARLPAEFKHIIKRRKRN